MTIPALYLINVGRCWRQLSGVVLVALLVLQVCSCDSRSVDDQALRKSREVTPATRAESMDFRVLVFNIEYGGGDATDRVIKTLEADVVGVLESYDRLPEIALKTGYPYFNLGLQILSKYPIHEPSGADGLYALIEVQPGYVVAFFNAHLDYVEFGPQRLAEGIALEEVLAAENEVRLPSIRILIPYLQKLAEAGYPVFLTGDFNEPSSLDYTPETAAVREEISEPVSWPVSEVLLGIGMRDTFRIIHPDPVKRPALTQGAVRIDYVYAGGPVAVMDSALVGESGSSDVDLKFDPWTSDHRAVLSSFQVTPVKMPTTVSLDRRMLTKGESLGIRFNAPGIARASIVIVTEEDNAAAMVKLAPGKESGETRFDTGLLSAGAYSIIMRDSGGGEIARNTFRVRSVETGVVIETDKHDYKVGEPVHVAWREGPANRWDWVAVYRKSDPGPTEDGLLLWAYTGGHNSGVLPPQVSGDLTLGEESQGSPWPLPAGEYRIYYLLTDQYIPAAHVDVIIE